MLRSRDFAHQLCVSSEDLPIEFKRSDYVSKWLITLLMDENSAVATEDEFPVITKKIRDEAWGNGEDFFRRSSFYMSVKAMLQHSLTMELGADAGESLYKIFMLKFLIGTCVPYMDRTSFDIDLLSQMIAKLARRIEKLSDMKIANGMTNLHNVTIDEAKKTSENRCPNQTKTRNRR